MPAITARALDGWIPGTAPDAFKNASFVLLYGGDEGGISALANDLVKGETPALRLQAEGLSASDLRAHLSTGGLFGPAAPVRISGATDKHVAVLRTALDNLAPGPRVVVEAGALKKDSKLKSLFEGLGAAAVLHPLDAKTSGNWLERAVTTSGMPLARGALQGAQGRLPSDRMRLLRMAEVLVLHAMGREGQQVEAQDVDAIAGNDAEVDLTQALMCALSANTTGALIALDRQLSAGENPIALMRAWGWKLQRIDDMVRSNMRPAQAVAAARPPVFFAERALTERALARLGPQGVGFALEQMDGAERAIVHGGQPPRLVLERWLMRLATWKG